MRYTEETKCGTPGCGHVFKSVAILYGTVANARCPKCNSWMTLPLKPEPTRIPVGEPKKIKECEQCASTQSLLHDPEGRTGVQLCHALGHGVDNPRMRGWPEDRG